eukprot:scaffold6321_cov98-Isochrysis_galbana.AAC.1
MMAVALAVLVVLTTHERRRTDPLLLGAHACDALRSAPCLASPRHNLDTAYGRRAPMTATEGAGAGVHAAMAMETAEAGAQAGVWHTAMLAIRRDASGPGGTALWHPGHRIMKKKTKKRGASAPSWAREGSAPPQRLGLGDGQPPGTGPPADCGPRVRWRARPWPVADASQRPCPLLPPRPVELG